MCNCHLGWHATTVFYNLITDKYHHVFKWSFKFNLIDLLQTLNFFFKVDSKTKYVSTLQQPPALTGLEGYNDVIWPHQSFRSWADIKIVADTSKPVQVYVSNPVQPAKSYPLLFSCVNYGDEFRTSIGSSSNPTTNPRQTPDKYKSNPAGLFCTIVPQGYINCTSTGDQCRQNCMTDGGNCPSYCYCTWLVNYYKEITAISFLFLV